ncbi:MAG: hypothetical protein IIA61_01990 [Candidatus Marinimicrobia bacterium]|nr:hypothetical protein [Candidatus Neomarinimicrobiota bacterium]
MGLVKDFEHEDPFVLRGVEIPGGDPNLQVRIMAEEFRDLGTPHRDLLRMFADPFYAGLYVLHAQVGAERVENTIDEVYRDVQQTVREDDETIQRSNP